MSDLAAALIASLDDQDRAELADALWPWLRPRLELPVADAWLPSTQAAEYLGISIDALHRLTGDPESGIPFTRDQPGGRCYFLPSELDAWRRNSPHAARNGTAAAV